MKTIDSPNSGPNAAARSENMRGKRAIAILDDTMPELAALPIGFLSTEVQVYTARGWVPVRYYEGTPFVRLDRKPWTLSVHDVRQLRDDGLIRHVRREPHTLCGPVHHPAKDQPVWLTSVGDTFAASYVDTSGDHMRLTAYVEGTNTAEIVRDCIQRVNQIRGILCPKSLSRQSGTR